MSAGNFGGGGGEARPLYSEKKALFDENAFFLSILISFWGTFSGGPKCFFFFFRTLKCTNLGFRGSGAL